MAGLLLVFSHIGVLKSRPKNASITGQMNLSQHLRASRQKVRAANRCGPDLGWFFPPQVIQSRTSLISMPSCLGFKIPDVVKMAYQD